MRRSSLWLLSLLVGLLSVLPARGQADPDPARFSDAIEAFRQHDRLNASPETPVLFVGSSSIRFWPTAERFPDLPVVNRGFGGSHISDVLHYYDAVVAPYDASVIVFYAGDNDVAGGKSAEQVDADYAAFVERVHASSPSTDIVFVPIKPSLARWELWPEMERANALIRARSEAHPRLHYVDIASPMLGDDGRPVEALFIDDGLHLSPAGYDLWTATIAPLLQTLTDR